MILDEQNRVLLVKHVPEKEGFWAGKYICPGGRFEPSESLEEGVRQEVLEETGLEISILHWVRPMERIICDSEGSLLEYIVYLDVVAKVKQGHFEPASDVGEGAWFKKEDLTKIRNEIHEETTEAAYGGRITPQVMNTL